MSVTVIYHFQAAPGSSDALLAMLQQAREFGLTVEGCEAYEVYQGQEEPQQFVMIEQWRSVEAHQAHFEKNVRASGVLDRVAALLAQPLQEGYYLRH